MKWREQRLERERKKLWEFLAPTFFLFFRSLSFSFGRFQKPQSARARERERRALSRWAPRALRSLPLSHKDGTAAAPGDDRRL